MKILVIRGQNLASLARPFELDLTAEPLAGAGLFAITGETGSGKSTILDALCLALYNQYPRVAIARRQGELLPDPGGDALAITDPRSILRRGAASGFAEVDFLAQDGLEYRARWTVNRARGKADGKLGEVLRTLTLRADGTAVAAGKTNVAKEIQRCTDLTFDQFRRTVLLAQGEFDTFLLAEESERADLLEKVTGTQVYGDISKKIHEQTTTLRRAVAELEKERRDIGLLSDGARAERQTEQEACLTGIAAHQRTRTALQAELQAKNTLASAHAALSLAEDALAHAAAHVQQTQPQVERLALLDTIETVRATQVLAVAAKAALPAACAEQTRAQETLKTKDAESQVARLHLDDVLAHHNQAEAAFKELGPVWTRAEQLDAVIVLQEASCQQATLEAGQAKTKLVAKQGALAGLASTQRQQQASFDQNSAQLGQSAADASLDQQWAETQNLIARHAEQTRLDRRYAGAWQKAKRALDQLGREEAAAGERLQAGEQVRAARAEAAERLRASVTAADEAGLEQKQASFAALLPLVEEAHRVSQQHHQVTEERTAATATQAAAVRAREQAQALALQAETARREQVRIRARLLPLDELAQQSVSVQATRLRSFLVQGEACPVCGASEHPAQNNEALHQLAQDLRSQRQAADDAIAGCDLQSSQAAASSATAKAQRTAAEGRLQKAQQSIAELVARYAILHSQLAGVEAQSEPPASLDAHSTTLLQALLEQTRTAQQPVQIALSGVRASRHQLTDEDLAVAQARDAVDGIRKELEEFTKRGVPTAKDEERARGESLRAAQDLAATGDAVRQVLVDAGVDPGLISSSPDLVRSTLQTRVTAFADLRKLVEGLAQSLRALDTEISGGTLELKHAAESEERLGSIVQERAGSLAALRTERGALLDGEATAVHRSRHNEARLRLEELSRQAHDRRNLADSAQSAAASTLAAAAAALLRAGREADSTSRAFQQQCAAIHQTEEFVNRTLALAPGERHALQAGIERVGREHVAAQAAFQARSQDFAEARKGVDESRPETEITAEVGRIEQLIEEAQQALGAINGALARDVEAQQHAKSLSLDIEQQQAVLDEWDAVDDAIGSTDGTRFRKFAQGTTLAHLTGLANVHLSVLGPRYSLLQGYDASELTIYVLDRDMDDQVRSSRSLSGGERFIISLALALALSGLEGKSSFVDTLFIDEGFGSLDRDTLDMAVDALERLQSSGRKVGVITHVSAMIERIAVQIKVQKLGGGLSEIAGLSAH